VLDGVANIYRAQGDYLIKREQAAKLREQVRTLQLARRRLELEQWDWEREFRARLPNRQLETWRRERVEYSRNFPAMGEIANGDPLNTLYDELLKRPKIAAADSIPVAPECLAHVHVTVGNYGSIGMLKDDRIAWPLLLQLPYFAEDYKEINRLIARLKKEAQGGQIAPEVLRELIQRVEACQRRLQEGTRTRDGDLDWSSGDFTRANWFLREVRDVIVILKDQPDPACFLTSPRGKTVAELVEFMKINGVRFAPATRGGERFYVALHRALADELGRLDGLEHATRGR
jgi:hypothetical protein